MTHSYPGQEPVHPAGPYAGEPYHKIGSLEVLTPLALVTAGALTFFTVLQAVATFLFIEDYRNAARAGDTGWEVTTWADLVSVPLFATLVIAYVCNCLWLQRARSNVLGLGGDPSAHKRSAVWVWLGWWVPIVSLWFPYQVVRDVWNESQAPKRESVGLGWWWLTWLVGTLASQAADRLSVSNSIVLTNGLVDTIVVLYTISAVAALVGVGLWARIVLQITRAQRERAARQGIMMR